MKYKVFVEATAKYLYEDIEAKDEKEAQEIAEQYAREEFESQGINDMDFEAYQTQLTN